MAKANFTSPSSHLRRYFMVWKGLTHLRDDIGIERCPLKRAEHRGQLKRGAKEAAGGNPCVRIRH